MAYTYLTVKIYVDRDYEDDDREFNTREIKQLITAIERHLGGNYEFVDEGPDEPLHLNARPSCMSTIRSIVGQMIPIYPGWDCDVEMLLEVIGFQMDHE
jgi:hypothetical protein